MVRTQKEGEDARPLAVSNLVGQILLASIYLLGISLYQPT